MQTATQQHTKTQLTYSEFQVSSFSHHNLVPCILEVTVIKRKSNNLRLGIEYRGKKKIALETGGVTTSLPLEQTSRS